MQVLVFYRRFNEGVVDHTADSKHNVVFDKANNDPLHGNVNALS